MDDSTAAILRVVGFFVGALGVLIPVVKWFISDWEKKTNKIEELRAQRLRRVEQRAEEVQRAVTDLQISITTHSRILGATEGRIKRLNDRIDETMNELASYTANLKQIVKNEVRTNIIQLTEQLRIVKEKRNGGK